MLSRMGDGRIEERVVGLDAILRSPIIDVELPMAELYRRISLAG